MALVSPMMSGMVFKPALESDSISLMSNGIVMANMNRKRSMKIKNICPLLKFLPDSIIGNKMVTADHTTAMRNIFKPEISLSLNNRVFLLKTGKE